MPITKKRLRIKFQISKNAGKERLFCVKEKKNVLAATQLILEGITNSSKEEACFCWGPFFH